MELLDCHSCDFVSREAERRPASSFLWKERSFSRGTKCKSAKYIWVREKEHSEAFSRSERPAPWDVGQASEKNWGLKCLLGKQRGGTYKTLGQIYYGHFRPFRVTKRNPITPGISLLYKSKMILNNVPRIVLRFFYSYGRCIQGIFQSDITKISSDRHFFLSQSFYEININFKNKKVI